ncbi:MAG: type 1 glutamine amidotransferase domain-containing protein [Candidatus Izemoplasmataceae bacterium]
MKKIAMLIENLFDDLELIYPYYRMQEEEHHVDLIGKKANETYKSKNGVPFKSDLASKDALAKDYDALIIPGGFSPDYMRRTKETLDFVKAMHEEGKVIAAICHAPWVLISSIDLKGKNLTGYHSIKDDIINAGANYLDQAVVIDQNIITSRTPNDLPFFIPAIIKKLK